MSERASISFECIAERYDDTRGGLERGARVALALAPYLEPNAPTLEVGVGTGLVATAMIEGGYDVVGLDLAQAMAIRARERIGPRIVVGDAARLPIRSGSMTQSYSVWVLHLVADPVAVLRDVRRALRPGGYHVDMSGSITDPNPIDEVIGDVRDLLQTRAWSTAREPDGVAAAARAAGFRDIEFHDGGSFIWSRSPHELADTLERRTYSWTWGVDDETWRTLVEPGLARLRELPDQPVEGSAKDTVIVMRI